MWEGRDCPWSPHPKTDHNQCIVHCSQHQSLRPRGLPLESAVPATALLVKTTGEAVTGRPLVTSVPHTVEASWILILCNTFQPVILYLWTAPHVTLSHYNNLNPAVLFPSFKVKTPHDYLMLTDHLLAPGGNLQETPLTTADFSWFTGGSYLKGEDDECHAGRATMTPAVTEAAPLPQLLQHNRQSCSPLLGFVP